MKKALKRRFLWASMAAFAFFLAVVIGGIVVMNYLGLERTSDELLDAVFLRQSGAPPRLPPDLFGYQFGQEPLPTALCVVRADARGQVLSVEGSDGGLNGETLGDIVQRVLSSGETAGKMGSRKFRVAYEEDGTARIALLDQTIQMMVLYDVLRTGAFVAVVSMAVMLLILQPVGNWLAGAWLRKTEQQKRFVTDAGHELKTPVAIIQSNADAMEMILGESAYSRNIQKQTERLDRLIRQLLMLARMDELPYRARRERVELSSLLGEELASFAESMAAREMRLEKQIAAGTVLRADRESLGQLIGLLMDNAICYGKRGSVIRVSAARERRRVRLVFANTVDKLPPCEPQRLLERFSRADSARTQNDQSGCGIGLSAADSIARMHRGSVTVEYPDAETFRVTVLLSRF